MNSVRSVAIASVALCACIAILVMNGCSGAAAGEISCPPGSVQNGEPGKELWCVNRDGVKEGPYIRWDQGFKQAGQLCAGKECGLWTIYYLDGSKWMETNYQNGEMHGLQTEWYQDGRKQAERKYVNGKEQGLETLWYADGRKKAEINYDKGEFDGPFVTWHENGQKKKQGEMRDGKKVGHWITWDENGKVIEEKDY